MDPNRQTKINTMAPLVYAKCKPDVLKCCTTGKSSVEYKDAERLAEAAVLIALDEEEGASDDRVFRAAIKIYLQWIRQEYDADRLANLKAGERYRKVPVLDYRALPWGAPLKKHLEKKREFAINPEVTTDGALFKAETHKIQKKALLQIFKIIASKFGIHAAVWFMLYKSQGKSLRRVAKELGVSRYRLGRREYNRVMKNAERSIKYTQALLLSKKNAFEFLASY
jgi:hypothetical protein